MSNYPFPIYRLGASPWFRGSEMPADERGPFETWLVKNLGTSYCTPAVSPNANENDGYFLKAYDLWKTGGRVYYETDA